MPYLKPALLLCAAPILCAQVAVHPFEPPPALREITPSGAAPTAFALKALKPQTCDPKGSITRDGSNVSVILDVVRADFTINNPDASDPYKGEDPVTLRSYGGCKAGPVIEALPGNALHVNLRNQLDVNDPSCLGSPPIGLGLNTAPGVGCFNTVNLHTHGLHVSPAGNGDNVLLNIAPGTSFPYEINIPSDHPAGTFWYHAHRHGSTSLQVASGASGALIIRGKRPYTPPTAENPHPIADIDTILHDKQGAAFPEKVFLFQQIAYACFNNDPTLAGGPWQQIITTKGLYDINTNGSLPPPSTLPNLNSPANAPWVCPVPTPENHASRGVVENFPLQLDSPTMWDFNGRFTSINGIVQPTLTLAAGEIQRWRFVHSGIHDTINLQIVKSAAQAGANNPVTTSALAGNRRQQVTELKNVCQATAATLIPQFEIAADGLTRAVMRTFGGPAESGSVGSNYLQPGYRSDILVVFPEDGDYCLLDQSAPQQERAVNGGGGQGPSTPQLLAYIHVRGGRAVAGSLEAHVRAALVEGNSVAHGVWPKLPANVLGGLKKGDLTPWAPFVELAPAPALNVQTANFTITNGAFQINGLSYDPNTVNFTRQVNTTDEWLLTAGPAVQGTPNMEPHIFHIHVNPFEVIDVTTADSFGSQRSIFDKDGNCLAKPDPQGLSNQYCGMHHVFKDTIFVENGYQVHVRTRYDRYIGEFVIHCHILDHEDGGMMLNVQIVPDLQAPGGGLGMPGMKHK